MSTLSSLVEQECHKAYDDDGGEQSESDPEGVELADFCPNDFGSSGNILQIRHFPAPITSGTFPEDVMKPSFGIVLLQL